MAYTETTEQFFDRISSGLKGLKEVGGVIEFTIEGEGGGQWTVDLDKSTVENEGTEALGKTPNVLVRARERDFMALIEGRMSPDDGVLTERLHLAGDVTQLAKLMGALESLRAA
jgi:putative sterol carrier protein